MKSVFARFARTAALVATLAAGSALASKPLTVLDGQAYANQGPAQAMASELYEKGNIIREVRTDAQGNIVEGTFIGGGEAQMYDWPGGDRAIYGGYHFRIQKNGSLKESLYCTDLHQKDGVNSFAETKFSKPGPEGIVHKKTQYRRFDPNPNYTTLETACFKALTETLNGHQPMTVDFVALEGGTPQKLLKVPYIDAPVPKNSPLLPTKKDEQMKGGLNAGTDNGIEIVHETLAVGQLWRDATFGPSGQLEAGSFLTGTVKELKIHSNTKTALRHGTDYAYGMSFGILQADPTNDGVALETICTTTTTAQGEQIFIIHDGPVGPNETTKNTQIIYIEPDGTTKARPTDQAGIESVLKLCAHDLFDSNLSTTQLREIYSSNIGNGIPTYKPTPTNK